MNRLQICNALHSRAGSFRRQLCDTPNKVQPNKFFLQTLHRRVRRRYGCALEGV